jgi:hypothetical protein
MVQIEECSYCGRDVVVQAVPAVADEKTWAHLTVVHASTCEWVSTRAFRRDEVPVQDPAPCAACTTPCAPPERSF